MRKLPMTAFLAACLLGHASTLAEETCAPSREKSPENSQAILQVLTTFMDAIKTKNPKALSTVVLNDNILFTSPVFGKKKQEINDSSDVNFDGVHYGGYGSFAQFLGSTKEVIEEKFYNVKVMQDGEVAWVMFDYQFLSAGTVSNHGVETMQMFRPDGKTWKILSVVWSSHEGA